MKQDSSAILNSRALVRLLGFAWITFGIYQGFGNGLDAFYRFNPNYFFSFFLGNFGRPAIAILIGCCLLMFSKSLGKRLDS